MLLAAFWESPCLVVITFWKKLTDGSNMFAKIRWM